MVCLWRRQKKAVSFIRKHFNMDCTINLPDSVSNSSLKLCQQQSWVTSGPRLLQHLLFLLTVLDEPSAANATLFGLVFLLLFFVEWGQEIHQQSYTALDKSTDGLGTLFSADADTSLRRSRKIITQSD